MGKVIRQLIPRVDFNVLLEIGIFQYLYRGGEDVKAGDELRLISWNELVDMPTGESITWVVREVTPEGPHLRLKGYISSPL